MAINNKLIMAVAIMATTAISSTCRKKFICADSNTYLFIDNNVKTYPDTDSVSIGDTIWIEFNLPTSFIDTVTRQLINYSNSPNFGTNISIIKFVGGSVNDPGAIYAAKKFNWFLISGKLASNRFPDESQNFYFVEQNNFYVLKVGIIPDSLGIYGIAISDAAGVYRKGDNCTKTSFLFKFSNTNQHLYLYQNNRPGYVISDYERQHMYCFKVY